MVPTRKCSPGGVLAVATSAASGRTGERRRVTVEPLFKKLDMGIDCTPANCGHSRSIIVEGLFKKFVMGIDCAPTNCGHVTVLTILGVGR
mmetsp:Transcript_80080/g.151257  ORF Transcript_80080/g.151257 Transcript_80080/m.151257 type:complete len:90 (-) Transcript_80080:370-639(-)